MDLFWDSMTKHIHSLKIPRPTGLKSNSLSYSGANISQRNDKLNQELPTGKKKADNVTVSGVIRRYDNKVLHEYIKKISETIHDLFKLLI